jgi:hypothetical protein
MKDNIVSLKEWSEPYLVNLRDNTNINIVVSTIAQHKTDSLRDFEVIKLFCNKSVSFSNYIRWVDIKDDLIPVILMLEKYWDIEKIMIKGTDLLTFEKLYLSTLTKDRLDDDFKIQSLYVVINGVKGDISLSPLRVSKEVLRRFRQWMNI